MLRAFLVQWSATFFVIHSHRGAAGSKNDVCFTPLLKTRRIPFRREATGGKKNVFGDGSFPAIRHFFGTDIFAVMAERYM